tara:strand:- start:2313 stop:2489 length:177 start_codon:yes stop_codon:yes gene_type:complete
MSKELWVSAYDEKYSELTLERDEGLNTFTDEQIDQQATNWAEGAFERAVDHAEYLKER